MTANKITDVLGVATPLSTKEKAFWYAVWVLDAVSYMVVATLVYLVHQRFAGGAIGAGLALAIGALAFGLTRYGLWRLTRPYATTADAVVPAVDRAELCNFDFKLVFVALALVPSTEFMFLLDYTIVYAAVAAVLIVGWVALIQPLKAANARDAAQNAEVSKGLVRTEG